MRVAVVGGGINGIMSGWALADAGHRVVLFERGAAVGESSSRSSKMLHGGLRYLEHGDFRLVYEGLRERGWWLDAVPQLAHKLEIVIPVYRHSPRRRLMLKLGLLAYDLLAGKRRLGWHRWLGVRELEARAPALRGEALLGGFLYFDGQMDDRALGLWALDQAKARGVAIRQHTPVDNVDTRGGVAVGGQRETFDFVVNAAGPWAGRLLEQSGIRSRHRLDLVRGSHLVVDRQLGQGFLLQSPDDGRVCFVLPYKGRTLIGTTEVRQSLDEPAVSSAAERDYLLRLFNAHFEPALGTGEVRDTFAGVRPLIAGNSVSASEVSREYALERNGRLITVFG